MDIVEATDDDAVVRVSRSELTIMVNALNYVCNAVDLPEFDTLIGADRHEAEALLSAFAELLEGGAPQKPFPKAGSTKARKR